MFNFTVMSTPTSPRDPDLQALYWPSMTAREEAIQLIKEAPDGVVEHVLEWLHRLASARSEQPLETAVASEQVLARDWDSPEDDTAWRDL